MKTVSNLLTMTFAAIALSSIAQTAVAENIIGLTQKSQDAAAVLSDIMNIPELSIPVTLLEKSVCVATVPDVIRAGFIFGARYGKGLVSCRVNNGWSKPSFIQLRGGSWGLQIGVEAIDLILVFTRPTAIERFSHDNFTVGADITAAAGPIGRDAQIGTDFQINSEIYSYSRARGLFAGFTLEGTVISVDTRDNEQVYGQGFTANSLLIADGQTAPEPVAAYTRALMTFAR